MVKQIVSGCPEENKSEMKSNQVQPCCMSRIDICDDYDDVDIYFNKIDLIRYETLLYQCKIKRSDKKKDAHYSIRMNITSIFPISASGLD